MMMMMAKMRMCSVCLCAANSKSAPCVERGLRVETHERLSGSVCNVVPQDIVSETRFGT